MRRCGTAGAACRPAAAACPLRPAPAWRQGHAVAARQGEEATSGTALQRCRSQCGHRRPVDPPDDPGKGTGFRRCPPAARRLTPGPDLHALAATRTPLASARRPLASTRTPLASARTPLASARTSLASARTSLASTRTPLAPTRTPLAPTRTPLAPTRTPVASTRTLLAPLRTHLATTRTHASGLGSGAPGRCRRCGACSRSRQRRSSRAAGGPDQRKRASAASAAPDRSAPTIRIAARDSRPASRSAVGDRCSCRRVLD